MELLLKGAIQLVTTIIFDLDDTLLWDKKSIQTAFDKTCAYAATKYDALEPEAFEEAARAIAREIYQEYETYDHTVKIGINPFEGLWGIFNDEGEMFQKMFQLMPDYQQRVWTLALKEFNIDDAAFGEELAKRFREERLQAPTLYEDTFDVLDTFKEKGYRMIMLTNGSPSLQNTKLELTPELVLYFEHIVISGDFGIGKPDASIFEHVLEIADITADEALMVGDNLMTDILGSSRVNMRNVWINRDDAEMTAEVAPTYEVKSLTELVKLVESLA